MFIISEQFLTLFTIQNIYIRAEKSPSMQKSFFSVVLIMISVIACQNTRSENPQVIIGDQVIKVEVAMTELTREQGLMNRDHLDPNSGMLFVFPGEQELTFWMKNTLIPLDIMFINSERKIVSISTMTPCTADPCTLYPSNYAAQYALEVPAGFAVKHEIIVGETVTFRNI